MTHQSTPRPHCDARTIREVGFEIDAPPVDEVVAHVRRAIGDRAVGGGVTGALDRFERDAHLTLAARFGQVFDGLPLLIAAEKVHPSVGARGIAL